MKVHRGYASTDLGQLHYCETGSGSPLVLLHQTPRSMDEFSDLMPLLAHQHRVLAMDMLGFGLSPNVLAPHTIEKMADGVMALVDSLEIKEFSLMGHHTGGAVAIEVAARAPDRISRLVLSSAPFTGVEFREHHSEGVGVDNVTTQCTGQHLLDLWSLRAPFYPPNRPDILDRFIRDALAPGVDPKEGHIACSRYHMEHRISLITCPTLLVGAGLDDFALPELPLLRAGLSSATSISEVIIPEGRIPLMEQFPQEVADAVLPFLRNYGG